MRISPQDLLSEYRRAKSAWPFITSVNDAHGLPTCLLYALGSRETNLRNISGDGGHGHGVFQLDDRWHPISPGFDQDVQSQTEKAAQMIKEFFSRTGDWTKACNCYNSGSADTSHTTDGDYGPDVMARQFYLATLEDPSTSTPAATTFSTWGTDVHVHTLPSINSQIVRTLPGPTTATIVCQKHAEVVTAEGYTNDAWSQLSDGSWISNIYIQGGAWLDGVPTC